MRCVILQPSYIPWRGYFHLIYLADIFIFYDDVKYDKNGWRNRNRIKTPQGLKWLTIPVHSKGVETHQTPINQIKTSWNQDWMGNHWNTLQMAYHSAPYYEDITRILRPFFDQKPEYLADFTIKLTETISRYLGIHHVTFMRSSDLTTKGDKTGRLIQILKAVRADCYLSGPSARDYLEEQLFVQSGIKLEYMKYDYREYPQLYPPYEPQVSILDLLFMTGQDALSYIVDNNSSHQKRPNDTKNN